MIKKILLIMFLAACLGKSAQAGLVAFDLSGLSVGATAAQISDVLSDQYGSVVTVLDATTNYTAGGYLDGMHLIDVPQSDGTHTFTISFGTVPISGLSFDWRRQQDEFHLDVTYADGTFVPNAFYDVSNGADGGSASGLAEWISFNSPFVSQLTFHDSNKGFIAAGNLVVNAVPLPASILMAAFAVGLTVWKMRALV